MLAQTTELSRSELKLNDDENKLATAPVHDTRVAEPASSSTELASTEGAEANADIKSVNKRTIDEEKPSWEEVIQNTTEASALLEDEASGYLEVLQAADGLAPASQNKLNRTTRSSGDHDRESTVEIDALQKSMIHMHMKAELNEAFNVASAVQQSRMDALDAKLESGFGSAAESMAEQNRAMNGRFEDLEKMIQRLEQMIIQHADPRPAI